MESRSKSFYLLVAGLCLCASGATAQSNSIDPRTALPAACIAPSAQTGGLELLPILLTSNQTAQVMKLSLQLTANA